MRTCNLLVYVYSRVEGAQLLYLYSSSTNAGYFQIKRLIVKYKKELHFRVLIYNDIYDLANICVQVHAYSTGEIYVLCYLESLKCKQ